MHGFANTRTLELLLVCLLACSAVPPVRGEVIERVLAVVDGSLITLSDVNAASDLGLVAPLSSGDPVRDVLPLLIDRQLQLAEVDRYAPPDPAPAEIDREVQAVQMRFPSPDAFEAALARSGTNMARLRDTVRDDLRIRAYLDQRFPTSDVRRQQVVNDWIAGLRRRADIVETYLISR